MTLTFTFSIDCILCGYHSRGSALWFGCRINKKTICAKSSFTAVPRVCDECGWPIGHSITPPRFTADKESQQKIQDARRKKGWIA